MTDSSNNEPSISVFMPPLLTALQQAESAKGVPLTKAEVLQLRETAACVHMTTGDAARLQESRGYRDIDPASIWQQWQQRRVEYIPGDDAQAAD